MESKSELGIREVLCDLRRVKMLQALNVTAKSAALSLIPNVFLT